MSGEWDHLSTDLGVYMNVIGRIQHPLVSTYVEQIKLNPVKILILFTSLKFATGKTKWLNM